MEKGEKFQTGRNWDWGGPIVEASHCQDRQENCFSYTTHKHLATRNKILLYSGLIHSHLVYGLPIWGFAKARKLHTLVVKQKKGNTQGIQFKIQRSYPYFMDPSKPKKKISPRQWINELPPNRQARLWNTCKANRMLKPKAFKNKNKLDIWQATRRKQLRRVGTTDDPTRGRKTKTQRTIPQVLNED